MTNPQKQESLRDIGYRTELDVLGYLLFASNRESKFEVVMNLEPSDFVDRENALIYKTLIPILIKVGDCDIVTVGNALKKEPHEVLARLTEHNVSGQRTRIAIQHRKLRNADSHVRSAVQHGGRGLRVDWW